MSKKNFSLFVSGALVGVFLATIGYALIERQRNQLNNSDKGEIVLKLGHGLGTDHPVHLALQFMAERVSEKSDGTVKLLIAPNGQLGTETECIELLQRGALAMIKTSSAPLESFLPEMAVFGVPYVFSSEEHYWKVLDGETGKELLQAGDRVGMHGLCYFDAGARSFYTKSNPIETPDDLKGLKLRVQNSQTAIQMVKALGGSPTPMNFGELYTGLQQGLVDGAENNPPSFYSSRHFEVCKEYSLDEHTRVPDMLFVSLKWWNRLSAEARQWIQEAANESSIWQRELWRNRTNESLEKVQAAGVRVTRPNKTEFAQQVISMHDSYNKTIIGELIARILEEK